MSASQSIANTDTTTSTSHHSLDTRSKGGTPIQLPTTENATEFALDSFINSLQLDRYRLMSKKAQTEYLENFDALDMFTALQQLNSELAAAKLETHFLTNFLERNEPRMLLGLQTVNQRRSTHRSSQKRASTITSMGADGGGGRRTVVARRSFSSRASESVSIHTTSPSIYTTNSREYRLNYKTKCEMAERATNEVEQRVNVMESKAVHTIKLLKANIEELQFRHKEINETIKSFQLHFLHDERDLAFLETANERQIERKFRKFINMWLKNGNALIATMRLRNTALHEQCQQLRSELITKAELSGVLTGADFELFLIKRNQLLATLEEKYAHLTELKGVTGKAALVMAEEKKMLENIEEESKTLANKTNEAIKKVGQLEREARSVEEDNLKEIETLASLKDNLERYQAPSVNEYVERKNDLARLEKEEKMLKRKIHILNMKLNNIYNRCAKVLDE